MAPKVGMKAVTNDPVYNGYVGQFNRAIDWASNLEAICNPQDRSQGCTPCNWSRGLPAVCGA
jgi:hypothetical protein